MVELEPHPSRHPFDVADSDQSGASSCTVTVVIRDVTVCAAIDREVSKEVLSTVSCFVSLFWTATVMPRTKYRSLRRKKRQPPTRVKDSGAERHEGAAVDDQVGASPPISSPSTTVPTSLAPGSAAITATASQPPTASQKKLCKSSSFNGSKSPESELETYDMYEGVGSRILEVSGIQSALQELCCKKCGDGPVLFKEDIFSKHGLCTHPYFFCEKCSVKIPIPFKKMSDKRTYTINRQSVLACKCGGDTLANLQVFCAMLDLPQPVSKECVH